MDSLDGSIKVGDLFGVCARTEHLTLDCVHEAAHLLDVLRRSFRDSSAIAASATAPATTTESTAESTAATTAEASSTTTTTASTASERHLARGLR